MREPGDSRNNDVAVFLQHLMTVLSPQFLGDGREMHHGQLV